MVGYNRLIDNRLMAIKRLSECAILFDLRSCNKSGTCITAYLYTVGKSHTRKTGTEIEPKPDIVPAIELKLMKITGCRIRYIISDI